MDTKDKTMIDDELLTRFFERHCQPIDDDGFTARVMDAISRQPVRVGTEMATNRLSRWLNGVVALLCVVVFVVADGLRLLMDALFNPVVKALAAFVPAGVMEWGADDWLVLFFRQAHHLASIDIMATPLPSLYVAIAVLTALMARRMAELTS